MDKWIDWFVGSIGTGDNGAAVLLLLRHGLPKIQRSNPSLQPTGRIARTAGEPDFAIVHGF